MFPGVTGFVVVGPLGAVGGTAVGIRMLISLRENYGRKYLKQYRKRKSKSINYGNIDHYGK